MSRTIAYYFTPVSPWAYLGHERFRAIARAAGADVEVLPVDYGVIFPASGGLPLAKRAPQRQAYRLVELRRFSEHLGQPLHLQPRHFPVDGTLASQLVIAVDQALGTERALDLTGALMKAVWAEERNIADEVALAAILGEQRLDSGLLAAARAPAIGERYQANTRRAVDAGVFGAPSYVLEGEIFWGQDRLEFLERALARGA
jgi:2-hydroxychromene-2-carboxylate isomerase